MAALHIQYWNIEPAVTETGDEQILYLFSVHRDPTIRDLIIDWINSQCEAGHTFEYLRANLVDLSTRTMVRVREFDNLTSVQNNIAWYEANQDLVIVDENGVNLFVRGSHAAQDNTTLDQFEANWPPA